jgi:hypothetical protein
MVVQGQPGQIALNPSPEITRAKWTGGVAEAAEFQLCKWQAPSSNKQTKQKNSSS